MNFHNSAFPHLQHKPTLAPGVAVLQLGGLRVLVQHDGLLGQPVPPGPLYDDLQREEEQLGVSVLHLVLGEQLPYHWLGGGHVAHTEGLVLDIWSEAGGEHFYCGFGPRVGEAHIGGGSGGQRDGLVWTVLVTLVVPLVEVIVGRTVARLVVTDDLEAGVEDRVRSVGLWGATGTVNSHGGVETDGVRVDHQTSVTSSLESDGTVVAMFQHFSACWCLSWCQVNNCAGVGPSLHSTLTTQVRSGWDSHGDWCSVSARAGRGALVAAVRRERQDWGPGRVSRVETTHDPGLTEWSRDNSCQAKKSNSVPVGRRGRVLLWWHDTRYTHQLATHNYSNTINIALRLWFSHSVRMQSFSENLPVLYFLSASGFTDLRKLQDLQRWLKSEI